MQGVQVRKHSASHTHSARPPIGAAPGSSTARAAGAYVRCNMSCSVTHLPATHVPQPSHRWPMHRPLKCCIALRLRGMQEATELWFSLGLTMLSGLPDGCPACVYMWGNTL